MISSHAELIIRKDGSVDSILYEAETTRLENWAVSVKQKHSPWEISGFYKTETAHLSKWVVSVRQKPCTITD